MNKRILLNILAILIAFSASGQEIDDCAQCSKKLLTENQLGGESIEELAMLRNEIFARKGHTFKNETYQYYFESQDWYKAAASNNTVKLSDIETQNVNLIKSLEAKKQTMRDAAVRDLKSLKAALNSNDKQKIESFVDLKQRPYQANEDDLKNILNHIDLNNLVWSGKGRTTYGIRINNGQIICRYTLWIEKDKITLSKSDEGGSLLYEDDLYNGFHRMKIGTLRWAFEMHENGIVFKECKYEEEG